MTKMLKPYTHLVVGDDSKKLTIHLDTRPERMHEIEAYLRETLQEHERIQS